MTRPSPTPTDLVTAEAIFDTSPVWAGACPDYIARERPRLVAQLARAVMQDRMERGARGGEQERKVA